MTSWGVAAWPEILAAQQHAHDAVSQGGAQAFSHFDPAAALEIEALVDQIIPSDDTPGAREAGVIYFIDRALATFEQDKQDAYRKGLAQVQARRKQLFRSSKSVAELNPQQRIELLKSIERSDFFQLLRTHTLFGFLGDPSHGGNRDGVGWKVEGFEPRMKWEPPFGYYDAEAKRGNK